MAFVFKRRKNLIHFIDGMANQVKGGFPLILGALSPAQTDATLLDVTCCVRLHTLLHVVGCCCVLLRKV